ncbi:hypothetical protein [Francisella tularensis]|uniref:Uncharacterized protein n=1 Tax=Francisella tularensis subsp. holarctica TaxID=119857 RepID=A0A6B2JMS3_FRATU|nr:hypothetical protein [Francisella tularensis]MBD1286942.1 hypothetical protein [Francisella tularensis subsp. holarctica]MBD1306350.1 hypothetical protein [Francisella tularensis subsp. holarctica]MBD1309569.1 hypothetical protein [Francisella tularensis subsp. holarctica]MBD1316445.1 hypothetical protein [Francisella tularensis subsp. holarctica]MBD1333647.1 hypothetical protein [Francisella tularensis subsp. holarctica]
MVKNKISLFSFVIGVLSIVVVILIAMLFPGLRLSAIFRNILLIILLLPWIVFMLSLLFSGKE